MSRSSSPRRMQLDGAEVVVLTPENYELLAAQRRQLGAQSIRMRSLRQQLKDAAELLDEIQQAVTASPECADTRDDCARSTVLRILAARRPP